MSTGSKYGFDYGNSLPDFIYVMSEYYSAKEIRAALLDDGVGHAVLDYAYYVAFDEWPRVDDWGLDMDKLFYPPSPYGDLP